MPNSILLFVPCPSHHTRSPCSTIQSPQKIVIHSRGATAVALELNNPARMKKKATTGPAKKKFNNIPRVATFSLVRAILHLARKRIQLYTRGAPLGDCDSPDAFSLARVRRCFSQAPRVAASSKSEKELYSLGGRGMALRVDGRGWQGGRSESFIPASHGGRRKANRTGIGKFFVPSTRQ